MGKKGLRLPRSSCSDIGNEAVSDPFPHRKRESQTLPCPSFPWLFGFPWLILSKEFPCLFGRFPWHFQGFRGFGREGKSLVNLGVFLDKTEQPRKGRPGFSYRKREKPVHPKFPLAKIPLAQCIRSLGDASDISKFRARHNPQPRSEV